MGEKSVAGGGGGAGIGVGYCEDLWWAKKSTPAVQGNFKKTLELYCNKHYLKTLIVWDRFADFFFTCAKK